MNKNTNLGLFFFLLCENKLVTKTLTKTFLYLGIENGDTTAALAAAANKKATRGTLGPTSEDEIDALDQPNSWALKKRSRDNERVSFIPISNSLVN